MQLWIILSAWLVFVSHGYAGQAAVAASMVLAVTYPEAGNLGGGGFMLVRHQQKNYFLDYRETAPSKAHRDVYLNEQGEVIPRQSLVGVNTVLDFLCF